MRYEIIHADRQHVARELGTPSACAKLNSHDAATLSRMEGCGDRPVKALSRNLESVLEALRKAGVEIEDDTIRLTKRRREKNEDNPPLFEQSENAMGPALQCRIWVFAPVATSRTVTTNVDMLRSASTHRLMVLVFTRFTDIIPKFCPISLSGVVASALWANV